MDRVRAMVTGRIIPTPGAVMLAAAASTGGDRRSGGGGRRGRHHRCALGDRGRTESARPLGGSRAAGQSGRSRATWGSTVTPHRSRPCWGPEILFPRPCRKQEGSGSWPWSYTRAAVKEAVRRHVGRLKQLFTPTGRVEVIDGRDLTAVTWVIGTGGALTRFGRQEDSWPGPGGAAVSNSSCPNSQRWLWTGTTSWPPAVFCLERWPRAAMTLLRKSLGCGCSKIADQSGEGSSMIVLRSSMMA